ncbi:MAG TPA: hypothetical protein VHB70_12815 [Parafilimonas sp.]|nr:hypothetical protein [Parafilimonas sp.]
MIKSQTSTRYFLEKTSNLLYELLIGEGDAKSRLRENESDVSFILNLDVPEKLKGMQREIWQRLTKKEATKFDGKVIVTSYQSTISSMRNSTASKIIAQISSLYSSVKYLSDDE